MQGHPNDNDNSSVRDAFLILILLASFLFVSSIEGDEEPRQLTKPEVVNYDEHRGRKQNTNNTKHAINSSFSGLFTNDWRLRTMINKDNTHFESWYIEEYNKGAYHKIHGGSIEQNPNQPLTGSFYAWQAGYEEQK